MAVAGDSAVSIPSYCHLSALVKGKRIKEFRKLIKMEDIFMEVTDIIREYDVKDRKGIQFSLEFHYEFYDDSIHVMNARSFNFCELQLLKAIEELQKYVGEAKIEVGIEKRAEGSLIETIIVTLENLSESKAFIALLTAFLTYFFTKKRSKLEDANKRLEILDKIKKADLTKEEALALIGKRPYFKKAH